MNKKIRSKGKSKNNETNENKKKTYQNIWNSVKAVLREVLVQKKQDRSQIN